MCIRDRIQLRSSSSHFTVNHITFGNSTVVSAVAVVVAVTVAVIVVV